MRTLGSLLAVLPLLVTGAVSAPGQAHPPSAADLAISGQQTFAGEVAPTVASDAEGDAALVTLQRNPEHPDRGRLVVRDRAAGGQWGLPVTVGLAAEAAPPAAAMSPSGYLVVAWNSFRGTVAARVRQPDGTWTPAFDTRARGYGLPPQVVVNDRGDVAVTAATSSGTDRVGVRRDGTWTSTHTHDYGTPTVGIDARGIVYAASALSQRGGDGDVYLSRLVDPSGDWSRSRRVTGVSRKVQEAQIVVDPDGTITLAVGYAGDRWVSTIDTEAYFTTAYAVLRLHRWGGPLREIWRREGVRALAMGRSADSGLRLAWSEWRAPAGARRPTHTVVLTQPLLPEPGRVVRLARLATTVTQGFALVSATAGPDGVASVLWQGKAAGSPEADAAGVAVFTDGTLTGRTTLPGTDAKLRYLGLPSLSAVPGGAVVGWSLTSPTSPRGDATVGLVGPA